MLRAVKGLKWKSRTTKKILKLSSVCVGVLFQGRNLWKHVILANIMIIVPQEKL